MADLNAGSCQVSTNLSPEVLYKFISSRFMHFLYRQCAIELICTILDVNSHPRMGLTCKRFPTYLVGYSVCSGTRQWPPYWACFLGEILNFLTRSIIFRLFSNTTSNIYACLLLLKATSTGMQFNASRFYGRRPKENVTLVPASGNLSDIGPSDDSFSDDDNDPDYIPPVVQKTSVLNPVTSIPDDSDSCSEETNDVSARLTPCSSAKKGKPSLFQWKEEHLDNLTKMPDDFEARYLGIPT